MFEVISVSELDGLLAELSRVMENSIWFYRGIQHEAETGDFFVIFDFFHNFILGLISKLSNFNLRKSYF